MNILVYVYFIFITVSDFTLCWNEKQDRYRIKYIAMLSFFPLASNWKRERDYVMSITERKNVVILTKKVESLLELKFDPGFRLIWLKYFQITRNLLSNFSSIRDSTFQVKMTRFYLSVISLQYQSVGCFIVGFEMREKKVWSDPLKSSHLSELNLTK